MSVERGRWTLADLTELDFRLREEIALWPGEGGGAGEREAVLHRWLRGRREADAGPARAAGRLVRTEQGLRLAAFGLFFLSGAGAALGLLQYEGQRLINVSLYLAALVFGQLGMLGLWGVSRLWVRRGAGSLYARMVFHFFPEAGVLPLRSLPVWTARAFASMQTAGVGFNAGVLLATGVKGLTSDLAFGWATTLDVEAGRMAEITAGLARVWGGAFAPSPEQVAASRIVLKEGLALVDARAAAAWWPFLMMCVLVYGLLPRLALAVWGEFRVQWRLRSVRLGDPVCERLVLRLTRAAVQFEGDGGVEAGRRAEGECGGDGVLRPAGPVWVMLPEAMAGAMAEVVEGVARLLGVPVASAGAVGEMPVEVPAGGVVMVQELWTPPLEEDLHRLRELRAVLGAGVDVTVAGVGIPEEGRMLTAPAAADVQVWRQALARLGDAHVQLAPWG